MLQRRSGGDSATRPFSGAKMTNVESIEIAVRQLPPNELSAFRAWFAAFDESVWDAQLEGDVRSGKLDNLMAEALADFAAGKAREL